MCFCKKDIPNSTNDLFIFKPTSCSWINGLASSYEFYYSQELERYIDKRSIQSSIDKINNDLYNYWPCPTCFALGYCFSICTLGLSFLCPYVCIRDAREKLDKNIEKMNLETFNNKGLKLSYQSKGFTSWLQLEVNHIFDNKKQELVVELNKYEIVKNQLS